MRSRRPPSFELSVIVAGFAGMAVVKMSLAARSCSCVFVEVGLNLLFRRSSSNPMNVCVTMPFASWQSPQALREGRVCGNGAPLFTISGLPS